MKKSLFLLLGLLTSVTVLAQSDYTDPDTGIKYQYITDNEGTRATLVDGKNFSEWRVVIPSTISVAEGVDVDVTAIGEGAFKGNTYIKYVVIGDKIKTIGKEAFSNNSYLQLIDLPNSLESIGNNAFGGCGRLAHIRCDKETPQSFILDKLKTLSNLFALYIPEGSKIKSAYQNDNDWKNKFGDRIYEGPMHVFEADGMKFVGAARSGGGEATLFWGKNSNNIIVRSTVNDENNNSYNVKSIGINAFYDDKDEKAYSNINTLEIKDGITTICNHAFNKCSGLQSITLSNSLTTIGESTFAGCSQLELLTLPASLKTIGVNAFVNCRNLKHVWCKVENVNAITVVCDAANKKYSFPTATDNPMMTLYVPNEDYKNDTWGTFFNTRILVGDMSTDDVYVGSNKFTFVYVANSIGDYRQATLLRCTASGTVTIPTNYNTDYKVTGIDKEAFKNQSGIVELTIPEHVTTIGANAFSGCSGLVRVVSKATTQPNFLSGTFNNARYLYVPYGYKPNYTWTGFALTMEGIPASDSDNGWEYIYSTDSKEAIITGGSKDSEDLVIPKTLKQGQYKVVAVDNNVFYNANCYTLTFEDDKESSTPYFVIGGDAFNNCSNLRIVNLPSQLKFVYGNAFKGCSSLNHIICRSTSPDVFASNAFPSTNVNATLYANHSHNGWGFRTKYFDGEKIEVFKSNEETYAGTYIGWSREGSKTAALVRGVPVSGKSDLVINSPVSGNETYSIAVIGVAAFKKCTSINSIKLPNTLTAIDAEAFNGCTNITDIEIESSPFPITDDVFSNYSASLFVPNATGYLTTDGWNNFKEENTYEGLKIVGKDKDELYTLLYGSKGKKAKLIGLQVKKEEIALPHEIQVFIPADNSTKDLEVKKIAFINNGLTNKTTLKKLEIGDGINYIGEKSFQGCTNLKELKLPASINSIGDMAFDGCPIVTIVSKISGLNLPVIAPTVFSNPIPLVSFFIPDGSYDDYTDANKGGWVRFKDKYIEGDKDNCPDDNDPNMQYEFYTNNNTAILTHVLRAPEGKDILEIEPYVTILGNDYRVIGVRDNACKNTTDKNKIRNLKIDADITSIGESAFAGCTGLNKVWLPSTLENIGVNAFSGCTAITHIGCEAVTPPSISESSFAQTVNPIYLLVPDEARDAYANNTYWKQGKKIFKGRFVNEKAKDDDDRPLTFICLEHETITQNDEGENVSNITRTAILTKSTTSIADVDIPEKVTFDDKPYNVTIIDESAFGGSSKLENLTLPESIEFIGDKAFATCTNLKNVVCKIQSPLSISDNVFYKTTLGKIPVALYVPENLYADYTGEDANAVEWKRFSFVHNGLRITPTTAIGLTYEYATGESEATLIKSEATSNSVDVDEFIDDADYGRKYVKVIAASAFSSTKNNIIKILTIPEGVNTIGENAFSGCTGLTELTLPSSLTEIGAGAFCNSVTLKTIYCDIDVDEYGNLIQYNDNVFPASFNAKTEIFIPEGSISAYQGKDGWKTYSDNYIEGRRISEAKADDYVKMTFEFMTGDHTATLRYVTELDVTEDGLVKIPGNVLYDGKTYTVKKIGGSVFRNVDKSKIKKLEIQRPQDEPQKNIQTFIDANAFDGCSKLEKVWLPSTLTSIGAEAFKGCTAITHIGCMADNPADISDNSFPQTSNTVYLLVPDGAKRDYVNKDYWIQGGRKIFEGKFINEKSTDDADQPLSFICLDHKNNEGEYVPGTAILTKSTTSKADVVIPPTVSINGNTYDVTIIDESAFGSSSKLENLTIPESIESIGDNAFATCTNLKNVSCKIANPLSISDNVFYKTTSGQILASLYVPETSFEAYTGDGANAVEWKKFPLIHKGLRIEKTNAIGLTYEYATGEPNATLIKAEATNATVVIDIEGSIDTDYGGKYVKFIAASAFNSIKNNMIKTLTIHEGVNTIGENTFSGCTGLTELTLPSTLTDIGAGAFCNSVALKTIYCNIGVDENGNLIQYNDNVFPASFNAKTEIFIPEGSIATYQSQDGWKAYSDNYIEGRRIPNTPAADYPTMVFEFLTGARKATLTNITSIEAVEDEDGLIKIPGMVRYKDEYYEVNAIGQDIFKNVDKSQIKKLEIQNGVRTISANAFDGCSNLKKVWLPASLERIGDNAFRGCTSITHIGCLANGVPIISESTFSKYSAYLIVYSDRKNDYLKNKYWHKFVEEKDKVYEGEFIDAFNYKNINYICVEDVNGKSAILTSSSDDVVIPDKVPLGNDDYNVTTIADYAFENNKNLVKIELPSTIHYVGAYAFQNCTNLKEVKLPSNLTNICAGTFKGDNKLESITLSQNLEKIGDDAFSGCAGLTQIEFPNTLTYIGVNAFNGNTNLESIILPNGIKTIREQAFQNCSSIQKTELPASLTNLGVDIFDGCSNLTKVISKIKDSDVFSRISAQSVPNAILYVPDGTAELYSGWDFLYTLEGDSKLDSNAGLVYAYTTSEKSGNKAILIGVDDDGIDEDGIVIIPSKVTLGDGNNASECDVIAVGKDAFRGNLKLKRLEIMTSLKKVGDNAFSDCSNLSEIICIDYNKHLNVLSQFDILLYVPDNDIKNLYVDAGWKSNHIYVGERKEKELDGLVYSFTTGGSDAILIGITDKVLDKNGAVTIPDNITFKVTDKDENETEFNVIAIANSVFKENTDVKMVTIGKNIASIGENAFDGCTNLKEIVSKIVNPDVISSIAFSRPDAILFIPNAALFDTYKAKWGVSCILVGERKAWNENGLYYVCATEDKNAVLVEGKAGEMNEDVVIPGFIEFKVNEADENNTKFNVIAIADNAFNGNTDIMTLKIGENVKTIGASAFQDCIGLNKIWLPESLDSIASKVFYGCSEINYICTKRKTPLTSPGMSLDAFSTFKATTTLYVPCGTIEDYNASEIWQVCPIRKEGIFVNERSLNGLTFECVINEKDETVAHLVKAAATKNVDIPSFVQLKNDEAKYMVTTICTDAFKDCKNVETIVLPESLESIAENVFAQCTKLSIITSKISKDNLFGFKKNVFPNDIYEKATVYIPYDEDGSTKAKYMAADGWKEFDNWAQGEKKTASVGDLTYEYIVGVGTATITKAATTITKASIDGSVTIDGATYRVEAIGPNAFKGCGSLKMVWLPATLKTIDQTAFTGCNNITHVSSSIESPAENEANYFPNNATLYVPKGGKDKYNVSGWNNVSYVAEGEFVDVCTDDNVTYDCLTIDDTKKAILRKYAASSNDVVIPDSVKLGEDSYNVAIIGKSSFANKTTITSLVIPAGVEEIDADVFSGCSKLTWIESKIESPIDITNKNVFANNTATLFIPSDNVLSDYRAKGWDFLNIYVGDRKETTIDGWTYVYSTGDKKAILSKATNVGKDVTINGSLKIDNEDYTILAISEAVFKGKTNIENLTISENVEDIGANAFQGCQNIEKVEFPSTLKAIGDNAFDQCSKLTIITNKSKTPAVLGKDVFVQSIYSTATVYVPNDAEIEAKYKAADGWKDFTSWAHGEKKTGTVGSMTYDYIVGVGTATLTGITVDKEDVTIDGTVEIDGVTYTVTAIAESAFKNNPNRGKMTKLRIAKNITTIGAYAFQSCSNLKMVWLPTSITSIGEKAFDGCNGITHVSSSIESPAENEANYFPNNATLYVPKGGKDKYNVSGWNNVSYVAEGEFVDVCTDDNVTYDCLTIDDTKKAILRKYAASSNDVVIPDSVKLGEDYYKVSIIGKSAFANKTSITSLIIPSGVEGIDADVFSGCSKLTWIESKIESPIDISGKNVFANNTATLFIPKDKVADYRAKGWDFLNIYVGDRKETTIDGWTYVYSTGDKKAILTKVNSVGKDVSINGSFKIGKDEYTVTAIAEAVFKGKTNIENLTVSENIENIGANAFHGCEKIEKVELPSTLKVIGDNAFDGCSRLVSITCNGATPATVGADAFPSYNLTLNVSSDAVEIYKKDATWGQFTTILGIVTSISDEDADDNTADYVDTTPSEDGANPTVTLVDGSDVHDTFAIPETVLINNIAHVVTAIGANAFKNNTNLKEVTISSNITSIGESAFEGCKNLASITVYIVVPLDLSAPATTRGKITRSGGSSIFEGVDKKTCILYVPSGSVDAYKAAPVWGDFENILPIGTTAINGVIVSDNDKPFDVYNMQGRKVKENTTTLKGLPSGIYIVNGKKLMVK